MRIAGPFVGSLPSVHSENAISTGINCFAFLLLRIQSRLLHVLFAGRYGNGVAVLARARHRSVLHRFPHRNIAAMHHCTMSHGEQGDILPDIMDHNEEIARHKSGPRGPTVHVQHSEQIHEI